MTISWSRYLVNAMYWTKIMFCMWSGNVQTIQNRNMVDESSVTKLWTWAFIFGFKSKFSWCLSAGIQPLFVYLLEGKILVLWQSFSCKIRWVYLCHINKNYPNHTRHALLSYFLRSKSCFLPSFAVLFKRIKRLINNNFFITLIKDKKIHAKIG